MRETSLYCKIKRSSVGAGLAAADNSFDRRSDEGFAIARPAATILVLHSWGFLAVASPKPTECLLMKWQGKSKSFKKHRKLPEKAAFMHTVQTMSDTVSFVRVCSELIEGHCLNP